MIPILFEKTETEFKTQGLGALTDAISCTVTEERNGSFELEMVYPLGGLHYEDIQYGRIILAVPSDGAESEPFEIYKITRPLGGKVTIYAQHVSYRLSYTATLPSGNLYQSAAEALQSLKDNAASTCPFTFSSDVAKAGQFQSMKVQSIRSLLGGQDGSVLDVFGGEYQWNRWNVNLLSSRGSEQPITLEYGKNITDLKQEENISSTYTAVIAMWTQSNDDSGTTTVYSDLVKTTNADSYPYLRTTIVDVSSEYDGAPTRAQLTSRAQTYINSNNLGVPKVSVTVSFVNLRDTAEYKDVAPLQTVHLCDTIKVQFAALGVDATAKVITTEWDVLNERYDSIEVGDSKSSLADTILSGDTEALKQTDVKFEIAQNGIYTEVKRAQGAEGTLSSKISQTADQISSEVSRATAAEGTLSSKISQNAEAITTKVTAGDVSSMISQSATSIRMQAAELEWHTNTSDMSSDGTIKVKGGYGDASGKGTTIGADGLNTGYINADQIWNSALYANRNGNGGVEAPNTLSIGASDPVVMKRADSNPNVLYVWGGSSNLASIWATGNLYSENYVYHGNPNGASEYVNWINSGGSDRRIKQDIKPMDAEESKRLIMSLKPSSYRYIDDGLRFDSRQSHHGFIAQDVKDVIGDSDWALWDTIYDDNIEDLQAVRKEELIADLVNVIQDQERRIAALEGKDGD